MTEGERVKLYNDLSDYEEVLKKIHYPAQTREIDIIHRAVDYVRGVHGRWINDSHATPVLDEKKHIVRYVGSTCSICSFDDGWSTFKFCPNCGARMKK